ncbi:MAG: pirin family protein [Nannocystaceae bacterium]
MLTTRPANTRGGGRHGWLDTRHTFSFADYHDPRWMGFRALRVLNDDRVAPGAGFPTHSHRDAEILSYVLEGSLEHRDSMGHGSVIRPGDVQRMSAGRGVSHSEYNGSKQEPVHFLQIWLIPGERGIAPGYEQKTFPGDPRGGLQLVASADGRDGSVTIHSDVSVYRAVLGAGDRAEHRLAPGRHAWVHVARGQVELVAAGERLRLGEGDGVGLSEEAGLELHADAGAEVLVFDLA